MVNLSLLITFLHLVWIKCYLQLPCLAGPYTKPKTQSAGNRGPCKTKPSCKSTALSSFDEKFEKCSWSIFFLTDGSETFKQHISIVLNFANHFNAKVKVNCDFLGFQGWVHMVTVWSNTWNLSHIHSHPLVAGVVLMWCSHWCHQWFLKLLCLLDRCGSSHYDVQLPGHFLASDHPKERSFTVPSGTVRLSTTY